MPTPPTRVSYTEVFQWNDSGASKDLVASISWQVGDVLVAIGLSETAAETLGVPTNTGTGLTWASQQANSNAGSCTTRLATAIASAASSGIVSMTNTNTGQHWGFAVWVWRGSAGVGNSFEQHTTTKTKSFTPVGADSAMCWGSADFSAEGALAATPAATNTVQSFDDGTSYSVGLFDLIDQPSAGAVSYGGTSAGSTGPYSLIGIEIRAAGSAPAAPVVNPNADAILRPFNIGGTRR